MDIRDLGYFETIATVGHFGRAAEMLGRTKPALSKCIRRLEAEIGASLFQRSGRGTVLTPPGRVLLARARRLRVSMADALREVDDAVTGRNAHIRIGLGTFIVDDLLPALGGWFNGGGQGITIDLKTGFNDALRRDLEEDRLDAVVSTAQPGDEDSFTRQDWFFEHVVVVARQGHPLAGIPSLSIADMAGYDWVLLAQMAASHSWLNGAFQSHGLAFPRCRVEISSYRFMPPFLRDSDLLGFTPRTDLTRAEFGDGLTELVCPDTTMRRIVSFLYRKDSYVSPAMHDLAEVLRRNAAERRVADPADILDG